MNTNNPKTIAMNNEYYYLQHLKAIPIAEYLHTTYGVEPAKRYNGYTLYHAPYREDFNASMKVDFRENLWYGYGIFGNVQAKLHGGKCGATHYNQQEASAYSYHQWTICSRLVRTEMETACQS